MSTQPTPEEVGAVISSLENPNYQWRTVDGIARETGLDPYRVVNVLTASTDRVVKSSVGDVQGNDLYTTRKHLRDKGSIAERLLGAFKNRAV